MKIKIRKGRDGRWWILDAQNMLAGAALTWDLAMAQARWLMQGHTR